MPFLLLLLLSLVLLADNFPPPWWGGSPSFLLISASVATWMGVFGVVAAAYGLTWWSRRNLYRYPEWRESVLHRYSSWRFYHSLGLFAFYGLALFGLGWGWTVQTLCTPSGGAGGSADAAMYPGAELLLLAPFFVGLLLSWAVYYGVERAFHETGSDPCGPFWSRRAYLGFHLRQNLALIVGPLGLMIVSKALLHSLPDNGVVAAIASITLPVAVFVSLPWILRLVLRLKPLPAGLLRDRLLRAARRLNFRCSDILLWNTNGGVANAMVAGILPRPRYVLLTDRLLEELTPDEVEAVFGHEVGHVKHAHMLFYVTFLILSLFAVVMVLQVVTCLIPGLKPPVAENDDWMKFTFVGIVGAYVFVVFGFLSRRCERQADVFGCRAVSCGRPDCPGHEDETELVAGGHGLCPTGIHTFIQALEKVAHLNGISRRKPGLLQSWQHSTIARRVDFLREMLADPAVEPRFQRTVGRVKWCLLGGAVSILLILGTLWFFGILKELA